MISFQSLKWRVIFYAILVVSSSVLLFSFLKKSRTSKYDQIDYLLINSTSLVRKPVDAIIILGGGSQRNHSVFSLPLHVQERLNAAIDIYTKHTVPIICSGAGSPYKPYYIENGKPVYEADSMANFLLQVGRIPSQHIYKEAQSLDTLGSFYFLRSLFTSLRKWCSLVIITSEFHMPRSIVLGNWIFRHLSLTRDLCMSYTITYLQVSDRLMDKTILEARHRKEQVSIRLVKEMEHKISTWEQLHEYIYTNHGAYCAKCSSGKFELEKQALDSY